MCFFYAARKSSENKIGSRTAHAVREGKKEKIMDILILSVAGTVISVAVGVIAAGIVAAAVALHFVRKKQGKTGCGCDCSGCAGCCSCHAQKNEEKPDSRNKEKR